MEFKNYSVLSVKSLKFSELDINDTFFDTLKEDYPGFEGWFQRKQNELSFVVIDDANIDAFLFMKLEDHNEDYSHFTKPLSPANRLKVGTFKITRNGFYLGERFFRIILEHAIMNNVEEIYVTIFPKREEQKKLIEFMEMFGFNQYTQNKNTGELVYIRTMKTILAQEPSLCNYPYVDNTATRNYYMLAIDSLYHTKLIPDSILREENPDDYTSDISAANAIQKIYIGNYRISPKVGDIIIYYRNRPAGDNRPAKYAATVTGFGLVSESYKHVSSFEDVKEIVSNRTVLTDHEIKYKIKEKKRVNILKFFDIYSFKKRPIREFLLDAGILISNSDYPSKQITKQQFYQILDEAKFKREDIFI